MEVFIVIAIIWFFSELHKESKLSTHADPNWQQRRKNYLAQEKSHQERVAMTEKMFGTKYLGK